MNTATFAGSISNQALEDLPLWRTVAIGKYTSPDEYRTEILKHPRAQMSEDVEELLDEVPCAQREQECELVAISVKKLLDQDRATLKDVRLAAYARGLNLCPEEVGPALLLALGEECCDESFLIATRELEDKDSKEHFIFELECSPRDVWLHTFHISSQTLLRGEHCVIFLRN